VLDQWLESHDPFEGCRLDGSRDPTLLGVDSARLVGSLQPWSMDGWTQTWADGERGENADPLLPIITLHGELC
jgi:hypothetical protein